MWYPDTRIFLAARSLWTKPFLERYSIPDATCWQNHNSICWSAFDFWDSLFKHAIWACMCSYFQDSDNIHCKSYWGCCCFRNVLKSPLESSSKTIIVYCVCTSMHTCVHMHVHACVWNLKTFVHVSAIFEVLTGSPVVTTPISLTTLGCLNCPLMAASWRNLTFSSSEAPGWSCFTATSMAPIGLSQTPWFTVPNSPDPNTPVSLK